MPERRRYPTLTAARDDTAAQLFAVVNGLERFQAGLASALGGPSARRRDSEAISLLREMLRLLTLIHTSQASAGQLAGLGGGTAAAGGSGGGWLGTLFGAVSRGLGLASLAMSIVGLFRGRPKAETAPVAYQPPPSISLEVANSDRILRGFSRFDFSDTGERRIIETPGSGDTPAPAAPTPLAPQAASPVQVTVNVSAIDARSFQDYAPALANAVRDAMLHMHPINQMVREAF